MKISCFIDANRLNIMKNDTYITKLVSEYTASGRRNLYGPWKTWRNEQP